MTTLRMQTRGSGQIVCHERPLWVESTPKRPLSRMGGKQTIRGRAALTAMHRVAADMAPQQTAANGTNNWSRRPVRQRSTDKGTGASTDNRAHSSVTAVAIVPATVAAINTARPVGAMIVVTSFRRGRDGGGNERCAGGQRQDPLLQHS